MSTQQQITISTPTTEQQLNFDYACDATFEAEKALITSYEDNWDSWDGPVWPWRETNVPKTPSAQTPSECQCNISTEPVKHLAPVKAPLLRTTSSESTTSTTSELWQTCKKCGSVTSRL